MSEKDNFIKVLEYILSKKESTSNDKILADTLIYVLKYARFDIS